MATERIPTHIALIPDGNRRWADMKGLPHIEGHLAGANRMHTVVEELIKYGIKYLTIWGFSTDNWKRSREEIETIFQLTEEYIKQETPWLHENGVKLRHLGHLDELPESLQDAIVMAMDITKGNQGMVLSLAFNYNGRDDIIDAVRHIISRGLKPRHTTKYLFAKYLSTNGMPDVDLVIRTAGEFRVSNFMLWQTAYSEYYFSNVFFPDFDIVELEKALKSYQARDRRFGGG